MNAPLASNDSYCHGDFAVAPLGDGQDGCFSRESNLFAILPTEISSILKRLKTFSSERELEKTLQPLLGLKGSTWTNPRELIAELLKVKVLVSKEELLTQLRREPVTQSARGEIKTMGIVTRDRPQSLERLLQSSILNAKRHERRISFVIMDDTAQTEMRSSTRQMLKELRKGNEVSIAYAGLEEKIAFQSKLLGRGLPPDVVKLAVADANSYGLENLTRVGANRNALLLHTVGDLFVSLDDDIICRTFKSPVVEAGFRMVSESDPSEFWFFDEHEEATQAVPEAMIDLTAIHQRLLGKTAAECIANVGNADVDCTRLSLPFAGRLRRNPRVLTTMVGLVGDCAWGDADYLFRLNEASLRRLTRSQSTYRSACRSREVIRAVDRPTLADDALFMSYAPGFDNRSLLPPFPPCMTAEDITFAAVLWHCFDDACIGHLPWVIEHAPPRKRFFHPTAVVRSASGTSFFQVVVECLKQCTLGPATRDAEAKLRQAGKFLADLGSLPLNDYEGFVRERLFLGLSRRLSSVEERIDNLDDPPAYWLEDVRRYLKIGREALKDPNALVPLDLVYAGIGFGDARKLSQRMVQSYGQLMQWWPDIVKTATELRERDCRLALEMS